NNIYADPEYAEILNFLAQNEWAFEHHASAPATQEAMVRSWEKVNATYPITNLGWRMLHPGGGPAAPSADTLVRPQALGAGIVPTNSSAKGGGPGEHPPYRRIYESGTPACLGTDALNVSPYPPFLNLWYVIRRQNDCRWRRGRRARAAADAGRSPAIRDGKVRL